MLGYQRIQLLKEADRLKVEANQLAPQFQDCFEASAKQNNRTKANKLKEKGRKLKSQCIECNNKAKEIWEQVKLLPVPPRMILAGMSPDWRNAAIEALQALPMEHVCPGVIEEVIYGHYLTVDTKKSIQSPASVFFYKNDRPRLVLRPVEDCQITLSKTMKRLIGHGVGLIVYRCILTDDERLAWAQLMAEVYYNVNLTPEEIKQENEMEFSICYNDFYLEKEMMKVCSISEYEFFQKLFPKAVESFDSQT